MPEGNPLVAKAPTDEDGPGPLTAGNSEYGYAAGIGVAESAMDAFNGISNGDWVGGGLGVLSLAGEIASAAIDPFGYLMSSVASFLMEHMQPLKDMLDAVAGDPPVIQSYSETWGNVAKKLEDTQVELSNTVKNGTAGWTGEAGDQYRKQAAEQAEAIGAAATVAGGISTVVMIFGEIVAFVREFIRQLIADAVGKLIAWVMETVFSLGFGTPVVVAQAVTAIAKWAAKIADKLKELCDAMRRVSPLLGKLVDVFEKIIKIFGKIAGKVTGLDALNPKNIKAGGFIQRGGRGGGSGGPDGGGTGSGDGPDGDGSGSGSGDGSNGAGDGSRGSNGSDGDSGGSGDSGRSGDSGSTGSNGSSGDSPSSTGTRGGDGGGSPSTRDGGSPPRSDGGSTSRAGDGDGPSTSDGNLGRAPDGAGSSPRSGGGTPGHTGDGGSPSTPHTRSDGGSPTHSGDSGTPNRAPDGGSPSTARADSGPAPQTRADADGSPSHTPDGGSPTPAPHTRADTGGSPPHGPDGGSPASAPQTRTDTGGSPSHTPDGGAPSPTRADTGGSPGHTGDGGGSPRTHGGDGGGSPTPRSDPAAGQHGGNDGGSPTRPTDSGTTTSGTAPTAPRLGDAGPSHVPAQRGGTGGDGSPGIPPQGQPMAGGMPPQGAPGGGTPGGTPGSPGGRPPGGGWTGTPGSPRTPDTHAPRTPDTHTGPSRGPGQTGPGGRPNQPHQPQPVARGNEFGPGAQPHTGTPGTHGPGNRPGGTGPGNTGPGGRGPGGHSGPPHSPDGHGPAGHGPRQDPNGHPDGSPHDRGPDGEPDRPLTPDEVNQRHSEGTPAGSSYHRGDADMGDLPHRVQPDPDGRYTVDVHVTPDGHARIGNRTYTPEEFADILRRNTDYDGRPIRLIGCDAGSNDFARRLSRELDTEVMAPSKPAWTDANGRVFSSDYEIGPDGRTRPRIPPNGEWDIHSPDGTARRASDDGFTPDTSHADKQDVDADSARDRGEGDNLTPQHQLDGRWEEPDFTPPARPVRLGDDQSFFDPTTPPRKLEPSTRYDITDADGNVRSRVYTDANRNVTHVDAVAPNKLHAPGNPEIMRPAPNSNYRVQVGHRHDTFPTDANGEVRTVTHTDVKTQHGRQDVTRVDHIESPPKPRDEVRIEADDPRAPGANDAFSRRTDLEPNTRYHVTDADGNPRGSFQTDGERKVRWVETPESTPDRPNPELREPLPDSNYRIDRGPLHEEYRVGPDGRPEHGQEFNPPTPQGDPVPHPNAVKQDQPFNRLHANEDGSPKLDADGNPTLKPNSVHRPTDEYGHPRGDFYTDDTGRITHVDTTSGQRGRTNSEVAAAQGAEITQDGHYGTKNASKVQDSWPAPDRELTYSHQPPPRSDDPQGFVDGDPDALSDAERKAISDKIAHKDPIAGRDNLPPNTRIHVVDKDGLPYGSFQTGPDGKITHLHTGQPFNPDLNNPPPNAVIRVDHGLEMHDKDGNPLNRRSPGEIHRTDERGNVVVTSAPPDPGGASNVRRDGPAQAGVGANGGKDASGKNIDDGGHHRGTSVGGSGEAGNQGTQGRVDNSNAGAKELAETYDPDDSWYQMERNRDETGLASRLENEDIFELRDPGVDDAHTRQYRAYGPDAEGRISVIVRSFPNDHNDPLWPDDFRG
ncbi:hypothetical protein [Amycolatopsis regifaucium]|uniref:PPE-repeat protein n=1 Tax=Amycolatopsis regifaucium TaxID=546365 RepID=A0A154MTG4_9PSEU|nr:hypothetical protein [Amycolatopsis regifaucium]KZB87586.1 hypothetical protein AVL48_23530 [Amycolatopsis regifaucium]OKA08415.1 hypothetical protein ATP06_0214290 [Amycolatopsis regifaucium]SFI10037.1 hypothetical protein SAMN04489731_108179 [Amycolatopsis regifaucium]